MYCPNCGEENDESARFCDNCGRDLQDAHAARSAGSGAAAAGGDAANAVREEGERTLWEGRPSPLTSPRMALTNRYKLTNRRLMIDHGFVGRRTEEIELYRFDDISVTQNVAERLTGKGDIHLSTSDSSSPEYTLSNVSDPDKVKDMIRDAAAREHERRRIRYREDV